MAERRAQSTRDAGVVLLVLLSLCCAADAQVLQQLEVIQPRSFGYVIGDLIEHEVHLTLGTPFTLDLDSLPDAGRLDRWLELRPPTVHRERRNGANHYRIGLTYQIVNAPATLTKVIIPQHDLLVTDGVRSQSAIVPQWVFTVAPLTGAQRAGAAMLPALRPALPPDPVPLTGPLLGVALPAAALAMLGISCAVWRWQLPWLARRRRPFARAHVGIRRLQKEGDDADRIAAGLRLFHHALNETAGQAVFADSLHTFFAQQRQYAPLQDAVTTLFTASHQVFFADPGTTGSTELSMSALLDLCAEFRDLERAKP